MLLHEGFLRSATSRPGRLFIVDRTLGRRLTFRKSLVSALVLARRFRRYDPGMLGVMLPNSAASVLAILATLMSGRVPVVLNYAVGAEKSVSLAKARCGVRTIITSGAFLDRIGCPRVEGMVLIEDILSTLRPFDKLAAFFLAVLPFSVLRRVVCRGAPEDTAVVLFTSGSEREPKPVALSHRAIGFEVEALSEAFEICDADIMLANLPFFHVLGLTANLWIPVWRGIPMVTQANPLDYAAVVKTIRDESVTVAAGTPAFWWGYLRASRPGDFATVRVAVVGADRCPDALRSALLEKHGLTLYEGYGTTETSPAISVNVQRANRPGSVGKPLPAVEVVIADPETGERLGTGDVGKVLVRGPLVMNGYLGDPAATDAVLRDGWYDTGDLGRLDDDGYLWLTGRLRRCVKVGGEMVSLSLVEEVLRDLLPEGSACCVVGLSDPTRGSRLVAVVTSHVDEHEIHKAMAAKLPAVALPKAFVCVPELPTVGGGKTDFRAVEKLAAAALSRA